MKQNREQAKEKILSARRFIASEKLFNTGTISGEWLSFVMKRFGLSEKDAKAAFELEAAAQGVTVTVKRNVSHNEDSLQEECVKWFDSTHPQTKELLHHSPNEGQRKVYTGARNKALGTRAGRPDLEYNLARGIFHGLFIELKTDSGRLSKEQSETIALLRAQGYKCEVARSKEEFTKLITEYENL